MKATTRKRPVNRKPNVKKSFSKRGKRREGGFSNALLIVCAVVSVFVAVDHWMNSGQVHRGVEVGGVAVGGRTLDEARAEVEARVFGPLEEIELTGREENVSLSAQRLGLSFDAQETAESAYAVGREGSIPERLADRARASFGMVEVSPETNYEPEAARAEVEALSAEVNTTPRDASAEVRGSEMAVTEAVEGYRLNVETTLENVERAVTEATGAAELFGETLEPSITTDAAGQAARRARAAMEGGLVLSAGGERWNVSPAAVGAALDIAADEGELRVSLDRGMIRESLSEVYAALTVESTEAGYEIGAGDEISVTPGEAGRRIQEERLMRRIEGGIFEGERSYEVPVASVEPELTTAEAERLKPTTLLGEYRTDYTWDKDPGRRVNMSIASDAINGTFVAPGEIFSFNAITEPLEYEQAKVIEEGAAAYAEGGGLSQVSSTLYMTANLAGLEILEANPHYAELPYIRPGLDTTVWFGALDLRFRNNTGGYILISQWQGEDGFNHATIHGVPTGKEVSITSEKVFDGVDAAGEPTTRWNAYKTVTQNGEVVFDGVFRTVTYKELDPYTGPTN